VNAFLDGIVKLRGTESGVAGQHRHVAGAQAVDRLAIGVEPDELPVRRDVDLVAELL